MKNLSFVFITALLVQFTQSAFSQQFQRGDYQGTMPMDAKITGTVIDTTNGQAVEYAIVAIRKMKDSSLPIKTIRELKAEAEQICGVPDLPKFSDEVVAVVKWVDGTVLDSIRRVIA